MMSPQTEKVLEELDWRVRVFDSLSFPTLILKPNKEIVCGNEIFLEKYGFTLEDLEGKKCYELLGTSSDPCDLTACPLENVLADKKGHSVLKKTVSDYGAQRWEDRVFSPILNHDGEVVYIIESFRDVSRLKVLEKTLEETKDFLEKIVQSSASAILAADMNGELLLANKAAEDLFGYTINQAARKITAVDLYPPGVAHDIMKKLRDDSQGGKGKLPSTALSIINNDGEEIPVEMTAAIIYDENLEVATMGIYNDLREKLAVQKQLKEAQAQLMQKEKMAFLGQLAAGVAHEINNPLTGILFYANLALESLESDNPLKEDLDFIIQDVHRCRDIVKSLLIYSRQQTESKDIIHLNDLVSQGMVLIRDQKVFAEVEVVRELADEMMMIQAEKNQMCQVVINLVMNAIDAMDGKGKLTIRTYRDKAAKKAYLEISDTGCGIPKKNLPKIFDPFFTTKELGKGTGLGLSTVYGIVRENQGRISVKDTGPEGTTFLVELPLFECADGLEAWSAG